MVNVWLTTIMTFTAYTHAMMMQTNALVLVKPCYQVTLGYNGVLGRVLSLWFKLVPYGDLALCHAHDYSRLK